MLTREELMQLKNTELVVMCKDRGIPIYEGKNRVKKEVMVDRLLAYVPEEKSEEKPAEKPVEKSVEKKAQQKPVVKASEKKNNRVIGNPVVTPVMKEALNNMIAENKKEEAEITPWVMNNKDELINKAEVGTLFAFLDDNGKPRTAKMVNRSSSRRLVKLVTEFEWEFTVSYDNVLWVRNGSRWPRAIYAMLKGYKYGQKVNVTKPEESE